MDQRRRALLGTVASLGLAGCVSRSELPSWLPATGHPLAGDRDVAIDARTASDLDLEGITGEALAYWNEHALTYAGLDVTFELVDDDPDVLVVFTDDIEECGDIGTDNILGCAPILSTRSAIERPVEAVVLVADRPRASIRRTLKHELGHLLGLDHDDEPAWIMSNDPRDRLPEYDVRVAILDWYRAAVELTNDGTDAYNAGIDEWNDGQDEPAAAEFRTAAARYAEAIGILESALAETDPLEGLETVDLEAVVGALSAALERVEYSETAAVEMELAAEHRSAGRIRSANSHLETANDASEAAAAVDVRTVAQVALAIGLVEGTREDDGLT